MDAIVCHRFRAPQAYPAIVERLAPGGLLAISVLSEVGADPGPYRASPGELSAAFAELDLIAEGEGDGVAWLMARRLGDRLSTPADTGSPRYPRSCDGLWRG